jgi:hypothetical protein
MNTEAQKVLLSAIKVPIYMFLLKTPEKYWELCRIYFLSPANTKINSAQLLEYFSHLRRKQINWDKERMGLGPNSIM